MYSFTCRRRGHWVLASEPPAARWPLPGGLLREPLSGLARADVVVLTRADHASSDELEQLRCVVRRRAPRARIVTARHQPSSLWGDADRTTPVEAIRGRRVLAFCAIGNPPSFFRMLNELGAVVLDQRTWPDHHGFDAGDVGELERWTREHPEADWLVCTMKDWGKLQVDRIGDTPLRAVAIEMQCIEGQEVWDDVLGGIFDDIAR